MSDLNNIQKICVAVFVGSLCVFLTTIFGLGYGNEGKNFFRTFSTLTGNNGVSVNVHINYLGIISIFNMSASAVCFFLFKNK